MSLHQDIEAVAASWLAREDAARLDAAQRAERDAWLDASPAHRVAWLRLRSGWRAADAMKALAPAPVARPRRGLPTPTPAPWRWAPALAANRRSLGLGATACAVALAAWLAVPQLWPGEPTPTVFAAGLGNRQTVALEDGSRLTLNTQSRVQVKVDRAERRVWVDAGEVFFDVAKDAGHPFVVEAGDKRITVLGTQFSVYRHGGQTQVNVLEGRVKVEQVQGSGTDTGAAIMTRGQSALAEGNSILILQHTEREIQNKLAWRTGRLVFEHQTVAEIVAEFNRYNKIQLVAHGRVAEMEMGGSFEPNNAEGFAKLLAKGFGVKLRTEGDQLHLEE